jgi:DNA-binding transcriptional ArsR family regulator
LVALEKYFKALANKKRIKIFSYLQKNGECCLEDIVEEFNQPYQTVFRNLSVLRTAGFIESRIKRNKALFKINTEANEVAEYLMKVIADKN